MHSFQNIKNKTSAHPLLRQLLADDGAHVHQVRPSTALPEGCGVAAIWPVHPFACVQSRQQCQVASSGRSGVLREAHT